MMPATMSVLIFMSTQYQPMRTCQQQNILQSSKDQMHTAHVKHARSLVSEVKEPQCTMYHSVNQRLMARRSLNGTLSVYQCTHKNDMVLCLKTLPLKQQKLLMMISVNIMESRISARSASFHQ